MHTFCSEKYSRNALAQVRRSFILPYNAACRNAYGKNLRKPL